MIKVFPALCLSITALVPHAEAFASDEALGRLFLTPRQRVELEMKRKPQPEQAHRPPKTLEGIVRRSDGHSTVWIDGQAFHDKPQHERLEDKKGRNQGFKPGRNPEEASFNQDEVL